MSLLRIKKYQKVADFLAENLSFLEQEESVNNLTIGIPRSMESSEETINLYSVLDAQHEVVFSLVQTPPHNYLIYGATPLDSSILDQLIPELIRQSIPAAGVIGPKILALDFAVKWKQYSGTDWMINFEQLIYQLDALVSIPLSKGRLRKAVIEDLSIVETWFIDFGKEAMDNHNTDANRAIATDKVETEMLYLWEDGGPVAMAAVGRPTRHGITVNYVYTPKEHRGKGYASSCVSELSRQMLRKYKFCNLFTNQKNPTSNRIYQRMGYRPLTEFLEMRFSK